MIKDLDSYRHGFIAGLDIKENNKTMIFGFELNEILDILEQHLKDKVKMPTKHIMTRAEAIAKLSEAMIGYHSVEKTIDFYIAAGMLEIKE